MRSRDVLEPTFEQYVIPRDFNRYPIRKNGVFGVATNDSDYLTHIKETLPNGKQKMVWKCPIYPVWNGMIRRGFSYKLKQRHPTYKDVSVCEDWLLFSKFREWWIKNNVKGWQLDKDILKKGNLVYSPDKCVYVPNYINSLLTDNAVARGEYPLGVYFSNKFRATVHFNGKNKHLGSFYTPEEAHKAWQIAKIDRIKDAINKYIEEANSLGVFDVRIVGALNDRITTLEGDVANERETLILH